MSITAMKQALDALEECRRDPRLKYEHSVYDKTITALRSAIEQAEKQEPVGMVKELFTIAAWERLDVVGSTKVYLGTPPAAQRQWVGLEQSDMPNGDDPMYDHDFFLKGMAWADAILRKKNTTLPAAQRKEAVNAQLLKALEALVDNEDARSWGVFGVDNRSAFTKARAAIKAAKGEKHD